MSTIKPKKKHREKLSNALVFLIVFLLFFAVFGGLGLWVVMKINQERRNGADASSVASTAPTVTFTAADTRDLFLVTTDKEAQGFLVVHADPANTRMRVLAVPRDTTVDVDTSQQRLYELYAAAGVQQAKQAVERLLNIECGNYAVISYDNVEKWVGRLGDGLIFTLPETLDYESEDDSYAIRLEGGARTLTAAQTVKVMRYPKWYGGRKQQADVQAQLLSAMLNQYLRSGRNLQNDFDGLIGLLQSDIKVSHFVAAQPALDYLASRNTGSICSSVSLEGGYVGSGTNIRFEAADDAASKLQTIFGNNR